MNQQGIPLQTCSRHTRLKRKQPSSTSWNVFLFEIKDWNRPSQNNQLNTSYIFGMDELPVSFGPQPERSTDGTFEKADLDRAMEILLEIVWHNGGFRYRKRYTNAKYLRYSFYCAQDIDKFGHEILTEITRDRSQMERFARDAIDATYGTNSAGSDLFAVLAEFDGTGVPSAYLFIEKSVENSTPGVPGKMVQILDQFMRTLLHLASPSSIQLAIIDLRKVCPNKLPGSFQYWMILIGIKGGIQVRLLGQEITKILLQCFTNI
ncbi:hypothetical protein K3495_g599 [Podosphaera aphanis]|nr:hypothetical protein K3495_g599 [Podosphaera aphanis]